MEALIDRDQWIVWCDEDQRRAPRNPYHPESYASVADSDTWATYEKAIHAIKTHREATGLGFVFCEDDPFVGLDLDDVADRGELDAWVWEIVDRFSTYTEWSPSETGVHLIGRDEQGVVQRASKSNHLEIYPSSRFFTMTGDQLAVSCDEIRDISGPMRWLFDVHEDRLSRYVPDEQQMSVVAQADRVMEPGSWVGQALDAIDPDCPYGEWVEIVGMGLHDAYDGSQEGFDRWKNWSEGGTKFEENAPNEMRSHWASFDQGGGRSAKSLWWLAENEYGWSFESNFGGDISIDEWTESLDEAVGDGLDADIPDEPPIQCYDYAKVYEDKSDYEPYLVDPQFMGCGDFVMVFGPPKSMKTLGCDSMVREWALGRSWMDFEATRPIHTLYMNFEVKKDAWRQRSHRLDLTEREVEQLRGRYLFTERFVSELTDEASKDILDTVRYFVHGGDAKLDQNPDLLVVDPAINFFPGDDENDNSQVIQFVEKLRTLAESISDECALLLVTHTSKVEYDDSFANIRGASAYRGAYDSGLYFVKNESGTVNIKCETRNSPEDLGPYEVTIGADGFFREIPDDIDGKLITAISDYLKESGQVGKQFTVTQLADEMSEDNSVEFGHIRIRETAKKLKEIGILGTFDPSQIGGPPVPNRSDGYLYCPQMTYSHGDRELEF